MFVYLFIVLALSLSTVVSTEQSPGGYKMQIETLLSSSSYAATKKLSVGETRMLFVAGLEGTGHHAWNSIFKSCVRSQRCEVDTQLTGHLMSFDKPNRTMHGLFGVADGHKHSELVHTIHKHMRILAQKGGRHLYLVGLGFLKEAGMLSYPNFNGVHKSLDHPDISLLASIAEGVGLDFRVIVLQRSAKEILESTKRRSIGGQAEPSILVDNAATLFSQLSLMEKTFYRCVPFHRLANLTTNEQKDLATFIHPMLTTLFPSMLEAVHYPGSKTNHTEHTTAVSMESNNNSSRLLGKGDAQDAVLKAKHDQHVEQQNFYYQEWQLSRRLALIDSLCAPPR
jgi:hypothetical protein